MAKPADFVVDNASGSAVRTDLNNIFDAISINNGFGSAPTQKYKYMWYADTVTDKMSFYKQNATDKIDFISLTDGNFFAPNGSASNPSYAFSSSTTTGFFRVGANQIGTSCNSQNIATFKESGIDVFGDFKVEHPTGESSHLTVAAPGSTDNAHLNFVGDSTYTEFGLGIVRNDGANGSSQIKHRGTGNLELQTVENATIIFKTGNQEKARIDDIGNFMVKATNQSGFGGVIFRPTNSEGSATQIFDRANTTATSFALSFENNNTGVGSISYNNTSTSFNTSSDYRLKQNETLITDGITRLKTLKPYRFNFKVDPTKTLDGFFAHEVTAVPEAVTGTKDQIDSDNKPVYQGIDQSKPVPLITAALQEAIVKIETLETKVAALEAS